MINGLRNLRSIANQFLDRVEIYSKLFAVEAKIAKTALIQRVVWGVVGAIFALFALAMLHVVIVSAFWNEEYQLLAMIGLLIIDGVIAASALYVAAKPAPAESFAVTRHQLAEDIKFIKESL